MQQSTHTLIASSDMTFKKNVAYKWESELLKISVRLDQHSNDLLCKNFSLL